MMKPKKTIKPPQKKKTAVFFLNPGFFSTLYINEAKVILALGTS